jgi:spermidine synthase/S-adenosylmethionine decarboxylase proenzyme
MYIWQSFIVHVTLLAFRPMSLRSVGNHALADISGSVSPLLNDAAGLEQLLVDASLSVGATVLTRHSHAFEPQGVTAVVVLSESHVSIHTWPEWGGATIDAYTCGDPDPVQLIEHVIAGLGPSVVRRAVVPRTIPGGGDEPAFSFAEFITPADRYEHDLTEVYVQGTSEYQDYLIGRSEAWGRMLVLDGVVQSTEADEFIYHEGIVHPACYAAADSAPVRNVMILGGGEGACLREALRWSSVESITMVDIDAEVVAACREHLPNHHLGSFDDPRVTLIHGDAVAYLASLPDNSVDVIVSDMTDPVENGPSTFCFTIEYFTQLRRILRPHGVLAVQAGPASPVEIALHAKVIRTIRQVFPSVIPYAVDAPCYGRDLGFIIASSDDLSARLTVESIRAQSANLTGQHRWITPELLVGKLSIPPYLVSAIAARTDVYADSAPPATAGAAGWES